MKKKTLYYTLFIASLGATALLTMKGRDALGVQGGDDFNIASCSSSSTSGSTGSSSGGPGDSMPKSVIALLK